MEERFTESDLLVIEMITIPNICTTLCSLPSMLPLKEVRLYKVQRIYYLEHVAILNVYFFSLFAKALYSREVRILS